MLICGATDALTITSWETAPTVAASGINAMDLLGGEDKKEPACNNVATKGATLPN